MLLNVSQRSPEKLQVQILLQIRAQILKGELAADESLPSIRALAKQLRVGVITIQRAYGRLLQEELVYARAQGLLRYAPRA